VSFKTLVLRLKSLPNSTKVFPKCSISFSCLCPLFFWHFLTLKRSESGLHTRMSLNSTLWSLGTQRWKMLINKHIFKKTQIFRKFSECFFKVLGPKTPPLLQDEVMISKGGSLARGVTVHTHTKKKPPPSTLYFGKYLQENVEISWFHRFCTQNHTFGCCKKICWKSLNFPTHLFQTRLKTVSRNQELDIQKKKSQTLRNSNIPLSLYFGNLICQQWSLSMRDHIVMRN
jgi:hypothetical protein